MPATRSQDHYCSPTRCSSCATASVRLVWLDTDFQQALKLYAGAQMAGVASSDNKLLYEDKASTHLRTLQSWLCDNLPQAVDGTQNKDPNKV